MQFFRCTVSVCTHYIHTRFSRECIVIVFVVDVVVVVFDIINKSIREEHTQSHIIMMKNTSHFVLYQNFHLFYDVENVTIAIRNTFEINIKNAQCNPFGVLYDEDDGGGCCHAVQRKTHFLMCSFLCIILKEDAEKIV